MQEAKAAAAKACAATAGWRLVRGGFLAVALGAPFALSACGGADKAMGTAPEQPQTVKAEDTSQAPYPNLASVPDKPPAISPEEIRKRVAEGLAADRANAEYLPALTPASAAVPAAAPPGPAPAVAQAPVTEGAAEIEDTSTDEPLEEEPAAQEVAELEEPVANPAAEPQAVAAAESAPPAPKTAPKTEGVTLPAPVPKPEPEPKPAETQTTEAPAAQAPAAQAPAAQSPTQEQEATAPPAAAAQVQLVGIIFFAQNSAQLNQRDHGVLVEIAKLHKNYGGKVRIVGHASAPAGDSTQAEQEENSREVALARATAVAQVLTAQGVSPDKIATVAGAGSEPVASEFMPSGEAGNRRAEIFLEY